ncbi:MAG: CDP-glucose 4,6-dehydratase [Bacteroidales bacterium]|nr:CDP-glucose 4,6-dehydratase [Bacteroidales bacterium]
MDKVAIVDLFAGIYKGKKVLVTGHTGFKGSWLVLWLTKMGADVCGYSLEPVTQPSHINLLNIKVRSEMGDIRDSHKLNSIIQDYKPEIVFHLAAQPLVRLSYSEPVETYSTNIMGTLHVLEACRMCESVRSIVVVTSDKCYENKEWVYGYRETDPMGGYDPYSSSKGCTELLVTSYRNSYFHVSEFGKKHETLIVSARAGNVIGGGDWSDDRLIPDTVKAASVSKKVNIRNPYATRPWQHVLEPLGGYLLLGQKLLEGKTEFSGSWNFGPDPSANLTVAEVLQYCINYWDKIQFILDKENHPHEAGLLKLDCSKAYHSMKWKETLNIEETFEYTIQWYKSFYEKKEVVSERQLKDFIQVAKKRNIIWTIKN